MTDDLSSVDAARLERWAYGRATSAAEGDRADRAAAELQRRAAIDRERAALEAADRAAAETHSLAGANGDADDASSEHPEPPLTEGERHRRRMLATGIAGVTAAALALGAGAVVLTLPNPDPLAIFERAETQLDRDWANRLESWGYAPFTAGPRAFEADDGTVVVAARLSTVPDGRSTAWDSYCLFVASPALDDGSWGASAACVYPEKFERSGIALPERLSANGVGNDTAAWGPTGEPQFRTNVPIDAGADTGSSVLDWLVYPAVFDPTFDPTMIVDDPSTVLMGPAYVPLSLADAETVAAIDTQVIALAYLTDGPSSAPETQLCLHITTENDALTVRCEPLADVRRDGMDVLIAASGRSWLVRIGADGVDRSDTVELRE